MRGKIILLLFLLPFLVGNIDGQTCCSGGVPLTGNLGMPSAASGTWQFSPSYDLNYMNTLKQGRETVQDKSRRRLTQSFLFETGYSISNRLYISGLFTYVLQTRRVEQFGSVNTDFLHGVGDAVVLLSYRFAGGDANKWELITGVGPKIPLGRSDMGSADGITYNADLQPGSGAWDMIGWGLLSRQGIIRPSTNLSLRMIYRHTGTNADYLEFTTYKFGNEFQAIAGISEQLLAGRHIFDPSLLLRFRTAGPDLFGGNQLPNTGGKWVYIVPGLVYHPSPDLHIRLAGEIPVYANLQGIQLTTSFRITAGIYYRLSGKKNSVLTF
jgi:hypothetical protein